MQIRRLALGLVFVAGSGQAYAFSTEDDVTPGRLAMDYTKASAAWFREDGGVVDGRVTTSPPGSTTFDRRLESFTVTGFSAPINTNFGLRVNATMDVVKRRQVDDQSPQTTTDQTTTQITPAADLTYVTDKGLELFAGLVDQIDPATTRTSDTVSGTSSLHDHTATVLAERFGVVRRSATWDGGFYYTLGAQKPRRADQAAFDGSVSHSDDQAFIPSMAGVIAEHKGETVAWDFDLSFVQARGFGPQDDNGNSTLTDYFTLRVGAKVPLNSDLNLRVAGAYQTLSYARSDFVTLDTIPVESLRALLEAGAKRGKPFVGAIATYGSDEQSIPAFNARYRVSAIALTGGFNLSL